MTFRHCVIGRFAAASLAFGAGLVGSTEPAFAVVPAEVLAEWVEVELRKDPEATPLRAVSCADRIAARARSLVSDSWPHAKDGSEALVRALSHAESSSLRIAAAAALGRILELASPAERIELVCRWTVSAESCERTTLARALRLPTPVFVADLALTELAGDPDPEVRAAAAGALRSHLHADPSGLRRVAARLCADPEPAVHNAARAALAEIDA